MIKITNFRKIKNAELVLGDKITLIEGSNGAGKTTILRALKSLYTGDPGVTKSKAAQMVNNMAQKAQIVGNGVKIEYPKLIVSGEPEQTVSLNGSDIRESVLLKSSKDATMFFVELLKANPTKEDLLEACSFIPEAQRVEKIQKIWDMIESTGWSNTEKTTEKMKQGQRAKWMSVTNENFKPANSEGWRHANWTHDLDELKEDDIKTALEEAKQLHQDSIAASAISEDKLDSLKQLVAGESALLEEIESTKKTAEDLNTEHVNRNTEINDIYLDTQSLRSQLPSEIKTYNCPCCSKELVLVGGKLEEKTPVDEKAVEEIENDIKLNEEKESELRDQNKQTFDLYKIQSDALTELNHKLSEIEKAKIEIENYKEDISTTSPAECAEKVKEWEIALEAYTTTREATKAYNGYTYYKTLQDVLSVNGVRKTKVQNAVNVFNNVADKLFPKWDFRADSDFGAIDGIGRPYDDFSDGEKWIARVIYQTVCSYILGDKILFIDVIEDVDRDNINKFFSQIHKTQFQVVIARASDNKGKESLAIENIPGCKKYVVEDGVLK